MNKQGDNKGFTLIEIMVAVALLAIISVLVFSSINSSFKSYEILAQRSKSQSEFARVFSVINDDLINIVPRPIRRGENQREGAFVFDGDTSEYLVEFTRGGSSIIDEDAETLREMNIDNPQTGLSRVGYKFAEETLYRYEWAILDRDRGTDIPEDYESVLLEEVSDVQVLVYSARRDGSLQEETRWPATALSGRSRGKEYLILPAGISLRIILKDDREYFLFLPGAAGVSI